jgi:hypothetical protein
MRVSLYRERRTLQVVVNSKFDLTLMLSRKIVAEQLSLLHAHFISQLESILRSARAGQLSRLAFSEELLAACVLLETLAHSTVAADPTKEQRDARVAEATRRPQIEDEVALRGSRYCARLERRC